MPLANYLRDKKLFADLRDTRQLIKASDFDDQFNAVSDYINNNLTPYINNIVAGAAQGALDHPGAFIRNVGDGTTRISYITGDDIVDYSLELEKVVKATAPGVILATDVNQVLTEVTSNLLLGVVLFSNLNNLPAFRRITADDIEDQSIGGIQIGIEVLTEEHLQPGTTANNVQDGQVIGSNFANLVISTDKYQPQSFEYQNLGILINSLPNGFNVPAVLIQPGTLSYEKLENGAVNRSSFPSVNNGLRFEELGVDLILPNKIAPQTIDDSFFFPEETFRPAVAPQVTSREITPGSLNKTMFGPDVQARFAAFGL